LKGIVRNCFTKFRKREDVKIRMRKPEEFIPPPNQQKWRRDGPQAIAFPRLPTDQIQ
jgi:hypothetical protein